MRSGSLRDTEPLPGVRRRAGSCPPQGRASTTGSVLTAATRSAIRSGLMAAGSQFRGSELGLNTWPYLAAGLGSNITARIISRDPGNMDLSNNRPPGIPGTLQLTVLVPVLLNTPRRTQEDVIGIGTTWTLGDAEVSVLPAVLSKLRIAEQSGEEPAAVENATVAASSGTCDSCGICLQPFNPGEELTALPCATDICPSVWHAECVRKWLCQGHTPTCPLCRTAIEISNDSGASAQTSSTPSFALEVRAALPLSATSGLQAAFSSGRSTSNQLLQQLGQVIIQDILLLTLSQHSAQGAGGGSSPSVSNLTASGLRSGGAGGAMSSTALADLGGLLLRSLTANGTLPVTLSAVETWAPGSTREEGRSGTSSGTDTFWGGGKGRSGRGPSKGRGKGDRPRGKGHHNGGRREAASSREECAEYGGFWNRPRNSRWSGDAEYEDPAPRSRWSARSSRWGSSTGNGRQQGESESSRGRGTHYRGKGSGKGASYQETGDSWSGHWSSSSWNSWNGWSDSQWESGHY
mmetsp:Transcript_51531/g.120145  ORF Transcript_51531/g.120145 Transcript_51531/m.120145 type:complete len:520 (+) Transcript_51531:139-1698(+)